MLPSPAATDQVGVPPATAFPQASCAVTMNAWVPPAGTVGLVGDSFSEAAGPTEMVTLALADLPFAETVTPLAKLPGVQDAVSNPVAVTVPAAAVALQLKVTLGMGLLLAS